MVPADVLISLPEELVNIVLSEWLEVEDVVNLDSAFCNHSTRLLFTALLSSTLILTELIPLEFSCGFVIWLILREVKCNYLLVETASEWRYYAYAEAFGESIRMVVIKTIDYENLPILKKLVPDLIEACPNASTVALGEEIVDQTVKLFALQTAVHPRPSAVHYGEVHPRILHLCTAFDVSTAVLRTVSPRCLQTLVVDIGPAGERKLLDAVVKFLKSAPALEELDFPGDHGRRLMPCFRRVIPFCAHLRHINLGDAKVLEKDVDLLLLHVKHLECINLTFGASADDLLLRLAEKYKDTLTHLNIGNDGISNVSFNTVLKMCRNLRHLYFNYHPESTLDGTLLSNLTIIHVNCEPADVATVFDIVAQNATSMKHFGLSTTQYYGDFYQLLACKALLTLNFDSYDGFTWMEKQILHKMDSQLPHVEVEWNHSILWHDFHQCSYESLTNM